MTCIDREKFDSVMDLYAAEKRVMEYLILAKYNAPESAWEVRTCE
jgi:hypothetical protein